MTSRREFIALLGGSAAWSLPAASQTAERKRRIGVLMNTSGVDPETRIRIAAFEQGLESLGWKADRNVQIDYRWGMGDVAVTRTAVAELISLMPDVILANGTTGVRALQQATHTLPIVFVVVSEPVEQGFVQSLARPGGNITGFTNLEPTIGAKWLDLLKEMAPRTARVAVMFNPKTAPYGDLFANVVRRAGPAHSIEPLAGAMDNPAEIEPVLKMLGAKPGGALIVVPDTFTTVHRVQIAQLARRHTIPAISAFRHFPADGGLASYGIEVAEQFRKAASYVHRILRGEWPGDLPVQQPTKFEFVINLETAKGLGLEIPPTLLARADEVIE